MGQVATSQATSTNPIDGSAPSIRFPSDRPRCPSWRIQTGIYLECWESVGHKGSHYAEYKSAPYHWVGNGHTSKARKQGAHL